MRRRQSLDLRSPTSPGVSAGARNNSRSNSKSSIIQVGSDNVVLVEVGCEEGPGAYVTRLAASPSEPVSPNPLPGPYSSIPAPCSSILATAGSNIIQAETILTSMGHARLDIPCLSDSEEEDPASLGIATVLLACFNSFPQCFMMSQIVS